MVSSETEIKSKISDVWLYMKTNSGVALSLTTKTLNYEL